MDRLRQGGCPIAASLYDETLKVWKVASGRDLGTLVSHTGYVTGVAVSGEGRIAVSASSDQILKVWEVETAIASLLSTCDSAAQRCAYTRGSQADSRWRCSGHVHFLRFEQPKPRPPLIRLVTLLPNSGDVESRLSLCGEVVVRRCASSFRATNRCWMVATGSNPGGLGGWSRGPETAFGENLLEADFRGVYLVRSRLKRIAD